MKNHLAGTVAATGLIIFIFGLDAAAQSVARLTVNIPFDFYVGHELLAKGRYEFEPASRQTYPISMIIRPVAKTARRAMIVPTMANTARPTGGDFAIVFNRYGSVHYLTCINGDSNSLSVRFMRTSAEKQLAKRFETADPVAIRLGDTSGN